MFTRIPRTRSQLRTAARQAAARPRRLAAALAAVTCALLTSAIVPAASAHDLVRDPPGGAPLAPVPAPAAPVVTAGRDARSSKGSGDPRGELGSGLVGEGEAEDLLRRDQAVGHQPHHPGGHDRLLGEE